MANLMALWDEVWQEKTIGNDKNLETVVEFKRGFNLDDVKYKKLKVVTLKDEHGGKVSSEVYFLDKKDWKYLINRTNGRIGKVYEIHADALTGLRGEYVKQQLNNNSRK